MTTLTTTDRGGGLLAVYAGRARIGYAIPSAVRDCWIWEVNLMSEQSRGFPRGFALDRETALEKIEETFGRWCEAAGLERRREP